MATVSDPTGRPSTFPFVVGHLPDVWRDGTSPGNLARVGKHWGTLTMGVILMVQWTGINPGAFGVNPDDVMPSQLPMVREDRR
jgi:hypothetical protein